MDLKQAWQIRPALPGDRKEMAALFLRVRQTSFTWKSPSDFQLNDFEVQTEGELIYVAELTTGVIAGFISVWEPDNFVHHLFIDAAHQHKGIGTALIGHVLLVYKTPLRLKCVAHNRSALAFYRQLGFSEIARGEDESGVYLELISPSSL